MLCIQMASVCKCPPTFSWLVNFKRPWALTQENTVCAVFLAIVRDTLIWRNILSVKQVATSYNDLKQRILHCWIFSSDHVHAS